MKYSVSLYSKIHLEMTKKREKNYHLATYTVHTRHSDKAIVNLLMWTRVDFIN